MGGAGTVVGTFPAAELWLALPMVAASSRVWSGPEAN